MGVPDLWDHNTFLLKQSLTGSLVLESKMVKGFMDVLGAVRLTESIKGHLGLEPQTFNIRNRVPIPSPGLANS